MAPDTTSLHGPPWSPGAEMEVKNLLCKGGFLHLGSWKISHGPDDCPPTLNEVDGFSAPHADGKRR